MLLFKEVTVKVLIAVIFSVVALAVPFWLTPGPLAIGLVRYFGFWAILFTTIVYLLTLRSELKSIKASDLLAAVQRHWLGLVVIMLGCLFLHADIDRSFKILYDEYTINATAKSMYADCEVFAPATTHYRGGEVVEQLGFVDKRPIFFPFVISLVHHLSGYRPENVFWLNSVLTFVLLLLVYSIVSVPYGRGFGILSVLLLSSLPLLAQNTTGGGYEIMNLCLIANLILCGRHYLSSPGARGLNMMLLSAILIANNRYESILYVLVPVALFCVKSYREKQFSLSWLAVCSPLFLILPLYSYIVFKNDTRFIGTSPDNFFSLSHLGHNLEHALRYLFDTTSSHSNSLILSALGVFGLIALIPYCLRSVKKLIFEDNQLMTLIAVFAITFGNTLLALTCWWGAWTSVETTRFSLPLQLFMALAASIALSLIVRLKWLPFIAQGLCLIYIMTFTHAQCMQINEEVRLVRPVANDWSIEWLSSNVAPKENLVISNANIGLGLYGYAHMPMSVARARPEKVWAKKASNGYDHIYLVHASVRNVEGPGVVIESEDNVRSHFTTELLAEKEVGHCVTFTISRITGLQTKSGMP